MEPRSSQSHSAWLRLARGTRLPSLRLYFFFRLLLFLPVALRVRAPGSGELQIRAGELEAVAPIEVGPSVAYIPFAWQGR